jgi:hypothetical protein
MPGWKQFSVFCAFINKRLLYDLMDFEIKSSVETFCQTTIEGRDDKACRVTVCYEEEAISTACLA